MYNEQMKGNSCVSTVGERETMATEIMQLAERIHKLAVDIQQRANSRLQPIMMPSCPSPEMAAGSEKLNRTMPPLFENLRQSLTGIERSLDGINSCLDRSEV